MIFGAGGCDHGLFPSASTVPPKIRQTVPVFELMEAVAPAGLPSGKGVE
jgi:hypothetical protein